MTSTSATRSPGQFVLLRAEAIKVYPEEVRAAPIFSAPAYLFSWGNTAGLAPGRFTVFDHVRHVTTERCLPAASLVDMVALALSGLPFTASGVIVLSQVLEGLPTPQLVFVEQGRPPTEMPLPWDLRGIDERIVTLRHNSGDSRALALQAVQPHIRQPVEIGHEVEAGRMFVQDALGPVQLTLQVNLHAAQHFRVSRVDALLTEAWDFRIPVMEGQTHASAAGPTSTTTTAVRITPVLVQQPSCRLVVLRGDVGYACVLSGQVHLVDLAMWRLLQRHGQDAPIDESARVVLASAQPTRRGPFQDVICLLLETEDGVTVLWDGRAHRSSVQTSVYSAFQRTQTILEQGWQERGWRVSVNGIPDAHMPRNLRDGDLVVPHRVNVPPAVVPLGWPLAHFPLLRPYALPLPVTATERSFARGVRLRCQQMGAHLPQEGMIAVYGPAHAELHISTGLHAVPTLEQAVGAIRRIQGMPGQLDFTIAAWASGNAVTIVSSNPGSSQHTILIPAPGYPRQFLPLMISERTRHLSGVPADSGVALVPQRRLACGDVLIARVSEAGFYAESDSSDEGPEATNLLQHTVLVHAAIGDKGHSAQERFRQIATPMGRRRIKAPAYPMATAAAGCRDDLSSGTARATINLTQCLPAHTSCPDRRAILQCGVTPDMFDFVFGPFGLELFDLDWTAIPDVPDHAAAFVGLLDRLDKTKAVEALQLFVDGSYFPDKGAGSCAGWAIVALGLQEGIWRWVGICASGAPVEGAPPTLGAAVGSCFEVELAAMGHALAVACALPMPVMIGYDSTSAGDLAQGFATADQRTDLSDAVVSLAHLLGALGRRPGYLHIRSHQQHPLNELTDRAAKTAARSLINSAVPETLADAAREEVLSWLWAAIGAIPAVPALTCHGHLEDSAPLAKGPSLRQVLGSPPAQQTATLRFRACTYNCLSLASHSQKESLGQQFRGLRASIVGLQETRCPCEPRQHLPDFDVLGSDDCEGQLGCQIWFSKTEPVGWLADEPLYWDAAGFSVLLRRPRMLLVSARIGCFRLAVLSAHALTAKASASDRRTWWAELHQAFAMIPCNCVPLVLIDANARLAGTAGTSADNAALMRQFLQRHELAHSSCMNQAGQELTTWVSPNGKGVCIDYVLYPRSISEGARSLGPVSDFEGLVDHDHKPVLVEFALRRKVSSAGYRPRLDLQHLRTPQGRIGLHCLLRDMPRVPWSAGVDEHLSAINLHISRGLESICPTVATRARRPTTSEATWFHIRQRRELRRELPSAKDSHAAHATQ